MKKGFIGSIGDDLPSLIPLFFALMIFFAGLAFVFTSINDKNSQMNAYLDSLTIAKSALGKSSYSSYDDFINTSKDLVVLSNYMFGLISPKEDFVIPDDYTEFFIKDCGNGIMFNEDFKIPETIDCDDVNYYFKSSKSVLNKLDEDYYNDFGNFIEYVKTRNYYQYVFPVTLYTLEGYKVVYLYVLTW
jgi:hypothetical protein